MATGLQTLSLDKVSKRYGTATALDDVSLTVARGETRSFGPQGPEAAKFAQAAAADIARRMNIRKIDIAGLKALEAAHAKEGGRPLHKLDVRDPAEYAKGHLKGFRHAAGGQQFLRSQQHAGRTEAALQAMMLTKRLLHRVQRRAVSGQALNGGDAVAVGHHRQRGAGLHRLAVEMHYAGAAL